MSYYERVDVGQTALKEAFEKGGWSAVETLVDQYGWERYEDGKDAQAISMLD